MVVVEMEDGIQKFATAVRLRRDARETDVNYRYAGRPEVAVGGGPCLPGIGWTSYGPGGQLDAGNHGAFSLILQLQISNVE